MQRLIKILFSFLLSGCVTMGDALFSMPDVPPPGYATLIVYRQGSLDPLQDFRVYVDDTLIVGLGPNTYSYTYVKEGQHLVRWGIYDGESRGESRVTMVAGETYVYKTSLKRELLLPVLPILLVKDSTSGSFTEPHAANGELDRKRYVRANVPSL